MPQEGKIQTKVAVALAAGNEARGVPIEMGARGEAVELWAIHHSIERLPSSSTSLVLYSGLSSNPELEGPIVPTLRPFIADKSIYGLSAQTWEVDIGIGGVVLNYQRTQIIPLYGIVRPRRQIWVFLHTTVPDISGEIRIEVYYRPISLNKTDLDALNLKFGKYRRGA